MLLVLLFIVHVFIALALIGVVMLQKSEGGALGMGGGGGMSGFMTGRSTANLLTRTTAVLAVLFFGTSIALVMLSNASRAPSSIVDQGPSTPLIPSAPIPALPSAPAPAPTAPVAPASPPAPSAPLAR
jgi:preprotein translocase subunit SecG